MPTLRLLRELPVVRRSLPIPSRGIFQRRLVQTLAEDPHIHVVEDGARKVLTYAQSSGPELSIGSSPVIPPAPDTFRENPRFKSILQSVLKEYAHQDPQLISEAHAFASTAGSNLGSGGAFFERRSQRGVSYGGGGGAGGDGAGPASIQGGMGGGGRGGHIHVSDLRNPPDYGSIADPEDILGSLEVDAQGKFVDGHGRYQESGTHRLISRNGILKLTPFIREKLIERLEQESKGH